MKRFFTLLISLSFSLVLSAQVSFFDDFEGPNQGWMTHNASQWEHGVPTMTHINSAYSGTKVWGIDLDSTYINGLTSYLYSPKFVTTGMDSAQISFWHYVYMDTSKHDISAIQMSVNNSPNWIHIGYLADPDGINWFNYAYGGIHGWSGFSSGWMNSSYKFDFVSPFGYPSNPDTIQFRFMFESYNYAAPNTDGWAIDDFSFNALALQYDCGLTQILSPDTTSGSQISDFLKVVIKNFGNLPVATVPLSYQVNNGAIVSEMWTGQLASGDSTIYTFSTPLGLTSPNFDLCVYINGLPTTNLLNDTLCFNNSNSSNIMDLSIDLLYPTSNPITGGMANNVPVIIKVKNTGNYPSTFVGVEYTAAGLTYTDTIYTHLNPGDSINHTFRDSFPCPLGNFQICVEHFHLYDSFAPNNTDCVGTFCFVAIDDFEASNFFTIIPNPTTGNVSLNYDLKRNEEVIFKIYNSVGQIVYSETLRKNAGNHSLELNLSNQTAGVYYCSMETKGNKLIKKLILH
jgi:hypothetical protein